MRILLTGGAGYIGSHILVRLIQTGHEVLVYDNYSNSSPKALTRVEIITGRKFRTCNGDIRDARLLEAALGEFRPDAVIHCAGLKSVSESLSSPTSYYSVNVNGTVALLDAMTLHGCRTIVFSSSATVYGTPDYLPCDEKHPLRPTNPYGRTKFFVEEIIRDWVNSNSGANAFILRYFNPVGAHETGLIGEDPNGIPNNLVPYIAQVAIGVRPVLKVFGGDYNTRDGSGERDFIHIDDLADAHVRAVENAAACGGFDVFNLGTGIGATVFEMIASFEVASGVAIPYTVEPRRPGDVPKCVAAVDKARIHLGWSARLGIREMCSSAWRWQVANPKGFRDER